MADQTHPQQPREAGNGHDHAALGAALEPALIAACGGRLSKVEWFRSSWQAGGAATGYAQYTDASGETHQAVVKLPVGPVEYQWTTRLSDLAQRTGDNAALLHPTLRVFASGTEINGYDLAWLIVERLAGPPLSSDLTEQGVKDLLTAAARWYALAERIEPTGPPPTPPDWAALIAKARDCVKSHGIDEAQRWNAAIKQVQRLLPRLVEKWAARPIIAWCHGDLHPGNAMRRAAPPGADGPGPCVLIDLALVHAGHWVEDAVYLERLYWGRSELLHGVKLVSSLAKCRKELGLQNTEDHAQLANVRRLLMAASAPAFLQREGHPRYLHAALEVIERTVPLIAK